MLDTVRKPFAIASPQNWHILHPQVHISRPPFFLCSVLPLGMLLLPYLLFADAVLICSVPSLELDCRVIGMNVLCCHTEYTCICVCVFRQHSRSCRRTSPSNHVLSISAPSFKWPLVSLPYLWALNGFTAVHLTASPPAIFLMMPLSNMMTQDSAQPLLLPRCATQVKTSPTFY